MMLLLLVLQADSQQQAEVVEVSAVSVPLCSAAFCPPLGEQAVGLLRFTGGLHLTSANAHFGGFSALRVAAYPPLPTIGAASPLLMPTALQFVAVSDDARLLTGQLQHDSDGLLTSVSGVTMGQLLDLAGKPLVGMDGETLLDLQDAEGLASTSDTDPLAGDLLVSFERLHRVWRYPVGAQGVFAVPVEVPGLGPHNGRISQCEENGGVEAMDFLHSGALLVLCEEPLPTARTIDNMLVSPGWLLPHPSTSRTAYRMHLLLSTDERPVAMARIPVRHPTAELTPVESLRGGLVVLLRSYASRTGNVLRIVFVHPSTLEEAEAAGVSRMCV